VNCSGSMAFIAASRGGGANAWLAIIGEQD
jgi:hypothetical protein